MSIFAVKIFSGSATYELAKQISSAYGTALGVIDKQVFSDGEMSIRFADSIRGCHVFIIQSTIAPSDNIWELFLLIDAAKRASANYVTVVIPYFGYARQDRKDKPRVAIAAKVMANSLTSCGADRILTCDLHAGQIQSFFDIPLDHLDGTAFFVPYIQDLGLENLLFVSPDVGGTARTRKFAKHFSVDMAICDKYRKRSNEIVSMQVIGNVEGKDVILVDDMVDTAGTMTKAATIIKEKGANSVRAIATHGVLSGDAYHRIESSSLDELIITNTIPSVKSQGKIKVISVAELFSKAIRKIHTNESVSSLFI